MHSRDMPRVCSIMYLTFGFEITLERKFQEREMDWCRYHGTQTILVRDKNQIFEIKFRQNDESPGNGLSLIDNIEPET